MHPPNGGQTRRPSQGIGALDSSLAQTPAPVNVQLEHDSWTFKDGAPADVVCLAQTNDGFLWLGSPEGLFRFDGTRFEPYSSPFGDRLLSTNVYSLFAPLSGGLWVGYTSGGFSFIDKGRVTNYARETGTVRYFAQDRIGVVWAGTTAGLWRLDHSGWRHIGVEWNAPSGEVSELGFDSKGTLWALVGAFLAPKDLIYLMPGTRHFKTAASNLSAEAFTWLPDHTVLTSRASSGVPVTTENLQMVDRDNSLWVSPTDKPVVIRVSRDDLRDGPGTSPAVGSETYDINAYRLAELVDRKEISGLETAAAYIDSSTPRSSGRSSHKERRAAITPSLPMTMERYG